MSRARFSDVDPNLPVSLAAIVLASALLVGCDLCVDPADIIHLESSSRSSDTSMCAPGNLATIIGGWSRARVAAPAQRAGGYTVPRCERTAVA